MIKTIEHARAVQARRLNTFAMKATNWDDDGKPIAKKVYLRGVAAAVRRFLKRNRLTAGDLI